MTGDLRHDARAFMFEMIVTNLQYETAEMAAMTGSAIVWLARLDVSCKDSSQPAFRFNGLGQR